MTREEQMINSAKLAELNSRTIGLSKKQVFMSAYIQGWKDADSYPRWIPIEEELPPENGKTQQSISVWATDGLTSGEFRYNFDTKTWTNVWGDPFDITYWMPLPQLPRNEDKDMKQEEKLKHFQAWLEKVEQDFNNEEDKESARIIASVKSMFEDIFDL